LTVGARLPRLESAVMELLEGGAARNGFPCHVFFERDPFLESLRGEERFSSLIKELQTERDSYRRLYRRSPCLARQRTERLESRRRP
jgi:hypothetical protein